MDANRLLQEFWRAAASDFGIEVVTDFAVSGLIVPVWVPRFGSRNGTYVDAFREDEDTPTRLSLMIEKLAREKGVHYSHINASTCRCYSREAAAECLRDWGWFGEGGVQI